MVHAEAQGSPSPIDATLLEDVMSFCISSIYQEARVPRWTTTAASILDTFKLDVALIASTDACLELASIGAHLPCDLEPRPGLPRRARTALPPPTCCPCATSTRRCAP